jgi:hypothetical protein
LVPKALLASTCADGQRFNGPFFVTGLISVANCLALGIEPLLGCLHRRRASRAHSTAKPESNSAVSQTQPYPGALRDGSPHRFAVVPFRLRKYLPVLIPGILSWAGALGQVISLVFIAASTLAGLRGMFILATACLGVGLALKDAPRTPREWWCIAAAAGGAGLVGVTGMLEAAVYGGSLFGAAGAVAVGLVLALGGYLFAASQVVADQLLLSRGLQKTRLLAIEGVCGLLLSGVALAALSRHHAAPANDSGSAAGFPPIPLDDPASILRCLHTPSIAALAAAYVVCALLFNVSQLYLAERFGANTRAFIFTARGAVTWLVEICIFYAGRAVPLAQGGTAGATTVGDAYGSALTPLSLLELAGYTLLVVGGILRVLLADQDSRIPTVSMACPKSADSTQASASQPLLSVASMKGDESLEPKELGSLNDFS